VLEARIRDDRVEPAVEALERSVDDGAVSLPRREIAVGQVDCVHLPAVGAQPLRDRGADALRGTGDQDVRH